MQDPRIAEVRRINQLEGNQGRIMLLYLLSKGHLDDVPQPDMTMAFEIAKSYHPGTPLLSF